MLRFEDMEITLQKVQNVVFSAVHKGKQLSLHWNENTTLVEYSKRIDKYGVSCKLKRKMLIGVTQKNEVMLEEALTDLKRLRLNGTVEDVFCAEEEISAVKIINYAAELYKAFLSGLF
jgi:hypothetical protein